jgi:FHS family L-fucose permease-like MFS transporter
MTTTEHADQPAAPESGAKPALVYPKMWVLFGVLI